MKIKLVQFPRGRNIPSLSPYCLKLETYLLLADIPHENEHTISFQKAPKKRFPYIELDGKIIADSTLIIDHLKTMKPGWDLDEMLTTEELALSVTLQRTVEDSLAPAIFYMRWCDPQGWKEFAPVLFKGAPKFVQILIGGNMHRQAIKRSKILGIGYHTRDEIISIAKKDLGAVSTLLGTKKFFFGDQPHMIDCAVFGAIGQITVGDLPSSLKKMAAQFPNLVKHSEAMHLLFQERRGRIGK